MKEPVIINGREYTMWNQFVEMKDKYIGGTLYDEEANMQTIVTDVVLRPSGDDSAFFEIVGEDFGCGFDVRYGGISGSGFASTFGGSFWVDTIDEVTNIDEDEDVEIEELVIKAKLISSTNKQMQSGYANQPGRISYDERKIVWFTLDAEVYPPGFHTSLILEIKQDGKIVTFNTLNSVYVFELDEDILIDWEPEADQEHIDKVLDFQMLQASMF